MTLDEVKAVLADHRQELADLGVLGLSIFGSVARGEAGPESDVDLLVELAPELDLLAFIGVKLHLQDLLGCPVDLVEAEALKPRVRDRVLREAVRAA